MHYCNILFQLIIAIHYLNALSKISWFHNNIENFEIPLKMFHVKHFLCFYCFSQDNPCFFVNRSIFPFLLQIYLSPKYTLSLLKYNTKLRPPPMQNHFAMERLPKGNSTMFSHVLSVNAQIWLDRYIKCFTWNISKKLFLFHILFIRLPGTHHNLFRIDSETKKAQPIIHYPIFK